MKITEVREVISQEISIHDGKYSREYIRYASNNWYVWMGESLEPIFSDKTTNELEGYYQSYLKTNNIP